VKAARLAAADPTPSVRPSEEHLRYLDQLRESGVTNMFGAAPYVQARFGVSVIDSRIILGHWMRTFAERHPRRSSEGGA
jgi:hypothetical protein